MLPWKLLPEVLRALAIITAAEPEPFRKIRFSLLPLLKDENKEILACTIIIMGNLKVKEATADLMILASDKTEIDIYNKGSFYKTTISELAQDAIKIISSK